MFKQKNSSMRNRIQLVCTSSLLIMLLGITALFRSTSMKIIYQQTRNSMYRSMENMQNDMDAILQRIEYGLLNVYEQRELVEDMKSGISSEKIWSEHYFVAKDIVSDGFKEEDAVVALYVYDRHNHLISNYRHAVTPAYDYPEDIFGTDACNSRVLSEYIASGSRDMLISSYYNESRNRKIARFALNMYNGSAYIGCIVCDVDSKIFKDVMKRYAAEDNNMIWMQPEGDIPVCSYGTLDDNYYKTYEKFVSTIQEGNLNKKEKWTVDEGILFCFPENHYNLELYAYMPTSMLMRDQKDLMKSFLIIAMSVALFSLCLSTLMSGYMVKPLQKITETMRRIREGDMQLRLKNLETESTEIREMGDTFNQMLDQMEEMIAKEYQTKLMVNQMEYKALQSQINPHFLYNTLDTMSAIAEVQNCQAVSNLSQALSHIFRYSLDMKHPMTTVEKEILHLKNYIYVMNVRMSNEVKYKIEADPQTYKLFLPRLTIQPLVENALKHGVKNVRREKKIEIKIAPEKSVLQIVVEDNGDGFDATELNLALQENRLDYVEKGSSIGIHNINARIRLLYGEAYGVRVDSAPGQGTRVIVTMPQIGEESENEWGNI